MPRHVLLVVLLAAAPILALPCLARAQDSIVVVTQQGDPHRYTGEVVDYTGQQLQLRTSDGRQLNFPSESVFKIETQLTQPHRQADEHFAAAEYTAALERYGAAVTEEQRPWVRRMILARIVWCQRYLDRPADAAETFLLLVQSDPATPYFDSIPLSWLPSPPNVLPQAATWLGAPEPARRLIGASWQLSGSNRQQAITTLQQLADRAEDPRIARLASTQLWRTRLPTVRESEVAQWQRYTAGLPEGLQAGPTFLVGQALARLDKHPEAALELMKLPILFPEQHELAPEALAAAGRQLEDGGQPEDAARLYRELLRDYPQSPLASQVQQRLTQLSAPPAAASGD